MCRSKLNPSNQIRMGDILTTRVQNLLDLEREERRRLREEEYEIAESRIREEQRQVQELRNCITSTTRKRYRYTKYNK